jgi:hypothetical protein
MSAPVSLYDRVCLSFGDSEDLLAQQGVGHSDRRIHTRLRALGLCAVNIAAVGRRSRREPQTLIGLTRAHEQLRQLGLLTAAGVGRAVWMVSAREGAERAA